MFVCPRPIVRNSSLILITMVVMLCIKDRVFEFLSVTSDFVRMNPDSVVQLPAIERNVTKRELLLVQMLFRHGHRAPFMLYPSDPNEELFWKEGLSELTKLGKLQHYVMGLHMRERYKDFLTTNPKEVEMISSVAFRAQYGAYSFIAGMYAPTKEYSFTDEIHWQPIVSRTADWKRKDILYRGQCKVAEDEVDAFKISAEANATLVKYKDLYKFWSKNSGRLISFWGLAADLGKTLNSEREYNLTIPEWALKYWDEFSVQIGITYYLNFATRLIQKYKIGPLLRYMNEQLIQKILQRIPEKKVFVYSAHGSNIACLLLALDQYNWRGPPYASTVALELWKDSEDYAIRWLYFNSSNPEKRIDPPVVFHLDGCNGEFCPLGRYLDLTRRLEPDNFDAECSDPSQKNKFKPFEKSVHIPGLSSSAAVNFSWILMSALLIYLFM